jgi:NAD(P)H-dependent FMN reductase
MPIYNGDWEDKNGLPDAAKKLKEIFINHDGFFIASPEYNSSFSPLLKNTIDWMSRGDDGLAPFKGKVAAIAAASPGGLGGMRGLVPLRMLLANIGVHVVPEQMALSNASDFFDDNDIIMSDDKKKMLEGVVKSLFDTTRKLKK